MSENRQGRQEVFERIKSYFLTPGVLGDLLTSVYRFIEKVYSGNKVFYFMFPTEADALSYVESTSPRKTLNSKCATWDTYMQTAPLWSPHLSDDENKEILIIHSARMDDKMLVVIGTIEDSIIYLQQPMEFVRNIQSSTSPHSCG